MAGSQRKKVENRILAALPEREYNFVVELLRRETLKRGQILYEHRELARNIYFPTTTTFSLLSTTSDGATVEVGIVGNEGVIGIANIMGAEKSSYCAVAQHEGEVLRANASLFKRAFYNCGELHNLLLGHIRLLIEQISQAALCNRFHKIEEQLSRKLLMASDSQKADRFEFTHEMLAEMLGTRRASVTLAASALQRAGLINYTRGVITIIDREGLEESSCECYYLIKKSREYSLKRSSNTWRNK